MSNLAQQQDGCFHMVAQNANLGRGQQNQMAHAVAPKKHRCHVHDQISYLRAQLAHRETQLEQVCAKRDNHFIEKE